MKSRNLCFNFPHLIIPLLVAAFAAGLAVFAVGVGVVDVVFPEEHSDRVGKHESRRLEPVVRRLLRLRAQLGRGHEALPGDVALVEVGLLGFQLEEVTELFQFNAI